MRARAFPAEHPDSMLTSQMKQTGEPFREVMDRRRGYVAKSASIHSNSPSKPSPTSQTDFANPSNGQIQGQGMFTSSPLQQNSMAPPPPAAVSDVFPPIPNPVQSQGQTVMSDKAAFDSNAFSQANFNFTSGQNGWNGLGNLTDNTVDPMGGMPNLPGFSTDLNQSVTTPGDGFDWMNWLSTANVTMMAPEEPSMGSM